VQRLRLATSGSGSTELAEVSVEPRRLPGHAHGRAPLRARGRTICIGAMTVRQRGNEAISHL